MTMKLFNLQRLPMLCATGILSTGLLLSGCSNNDNAETDSANAVSTTEDASSASTSEASSTQTDGVDTDTTANGTVADDATKQTMTDDTQPLTATNKQKSLVTNPTQAGTPEDTVKQALDSLYQGDIKKSAGYYKVDMANFEKELAKTQSAFEQTVEGVTITDATYNEDKTRATIVGELMLRGQSEPAPLTYELQKIDGQWKILG
ncbi:MULTISPECIES: hypothetical protein [Psychrobacter]|uniref:DUF4878 domain-containing protein n=1 Tax=Psychrobacter alimentarius TaxID=261164 RepID=A0ABM6A0E8_9GAMM|nr:MULTISPECIES: hypothetical protein [Psychrobacter]AMT97844.1 hypothetical protein A3K91_2265 [Psychrobacter alimentarius]QCB29876.1 hypothetical protein E5677_02100 [Psychrobacter sp. PAMC27889]